jgi:hypothetical protein
LKLIYSLSLTKKDFITNKYMIYLKPWKLYFNLRVVDYVFMFLNTCFIVTASNTGIICL